MELMVVVLSLLTCIVVGLDEDSMENKDLVNLTDPDKDMYVIHAMVYQIGILTNKTDDDASNSSIVGNQEAITFYRNNGSHLDLSQIPNPLQTNVTAQTLVGVAPTPDIIPDKSGKVPDKSQLTWSAFENLHAMEYNDSKQSRIARYADDKQVVENSDGTKKNTDENLYFDALYKRSVDQSENVKKDDKNEEKVPVKVVEGTSVIPQEARIQSIAIPPLLTLNNNFSDIPVPIPNTSVVRYAKINTLTHMP